MNSSIIKILFLFTLIACGLTKDEELDIVIDEANFYLSSLSCEDAKKTLDSIDYQSKSADYVSLYSAVYACRAGYTVLGTVFDNLTNIDATNGGLFTSLANFSSSNEVVADSDVYTNLKLAISEILKNSSGTTDRLTKYGSIKGTDLSMQLLFMTLTELGKYMGYYGNKGATGIKGAGAGPQRCLMNYTTPTVEPIIDATGSDSCDNAGQGPADLDPSDPDFIARACEGIVLHNVFGDIVSNLDFSSSDELGDLEDTKTVYASLLVIATTLEPAVADYDGFKEFAACEAYAVADTVELQRVFASYVENFYQ